MSRKVRALLVALALINGIGSGALFGSGAGPMAYGMPGQTANGGVVIGDCYHFDVGLDVWAPWGPSFYIDQC